MTEPPLGNPAPQFQTAEYSGTASGETCRTCQQPITTRYYRVNGVTACEACALRTHEQLPKDSHQAYIRALLFGVGGAIAGLALYSTFAIVTGLVIGYVSLAVGYIIGKALMAGSQGLGGRKYQITAAALTYAAVSMAAVPIAIWQYREGPPKPPAANAGAPSAPKAKAAPADEGGVSQDADESVVVPATPAGQPMGLASIAGTLVLVGLASPFLALEDPFHGIIGLIILFVGIRIAWKLAAGKTIDIMGPFPASGSGTAPPASG